MPGSTTQTNGGSGGIANSGTEWHTYGVEWTPSGVSWLIDGRVIFTAPASEVKSPAQQPALAMDMALQSQNLQGRRHSDAARDHERRLGRAIQLERLSASSPTRRAACPHSAVHA